MIKQHAFSNVYKHKGWIYFIVMVILSICLLSNISFSSKRTHIIKPSTLVSTVYDASGDTINLPLKTYSLLSDNQEPLLFQVSLPSTMEENEELLFLTTNQKIEVRMDGQIIYQYFDQYGHSLPQGDLGTVWHFVKIPKNPAASLEVQVTPSVKGYGYDISSFHLGSEAANEQYIYDHSNYDNIIAIAFFVLLVLTIFLLVGFGKDNFKQHSYYWKLIVFLAAMCVLYIIQGKRLITYFYHPLLLAILQQLCFIALTLSIFSFLFDLYKQHCRNERLLSIYYYILQFASVLYLLFYMLGWQSWKYLSFIYFVLTLLYALVFVAQLREYLWQQRNIKFLILLILSLVLSILCDFEFTLYKNFQALGFIILPIILLVILYIKKFINALNYLYLNQQLSQQTEFYHLLSLEHKEIRILNHDMKNHLLTIEMLINQKNYEESLEYLHSVTTTIKAAKKVISTSNPIIDAILTAKRSLAIDKGIDITYAINMSPDLSITPFDFCIIFGNLLDNAIEACLRSNKATLSISVTIYMRGKNMIIKIENTYDKEQVVQSRDRFTTSKKDKQAHGHGIISVRQCVARYNGDLIFEQKEDIFFTTVILQNIVNVKKEETI